MVCTHAAADRASPHRLPVRWASQARAKWRFGLGGNIRRNHCPRGLWRWRWSWSWGGGWSWRQYGCRRWQEEEITRELRGARVNCVSAVWVRGRCTVAWSMLRTHMYTCTRVMPGMRRQPMSRTSSRSRSTLVPGCSPPRNTTPPGRLRTPLARAERHSPCVAISDPLVKLVLDSHTLHTKVVDKSLAPSWEQSFKFPCDDAYVCRVLCVCGHPALLRACAAFGTYWYSRCCC